MVSERGTKHGARPGRSGSRAVFDDTFSRGTRAAGIPLVLWVCAAVVAHYVGGVGTMKAADVVHDRDELKAAVRSVRESLHPADTMFFDVVTDSPEALPVAKMEPPKEDGADPKADGEPDPDAVPDPAKVKPLPTPKKDEPRKEEPPKVAEKEPPKPKEEPKPVPAVPLPTVPAPPPPELDDHRIAVRQHAEKDQPDNPTANRIADDANHVEHETVARNRSHDQDAKDPSFGASKGPKDPEPGSGDKEDKVAQSEDKKGNEDHAPGENSAHATDSHHEAPRAQVPPTPGAKAPAASVPGGKGGLGNAPAIPTPPSSPGGAGPAAPDAMMADNGTYTLDPANPGGDGRSKRPGKKRNPSMWQTPVHVGALGLGGTGMPGGPQINLTQKGVEQAVGAEQLHAERVADGAARRSAHRGGWEKNKFSKWKAAIENYEPQVELGNTTALNAARSPFAAYINDIHNRIHPIFAETFLAAIQGLPRDNPLNQPTNITHLEIVLDKDTGAIVRMGVTRTSGVTAFDMVALDSVQRASPFGKAPGIIASPDGRVYLHWEFHNDPDACTTRNARPFILKSAPTVRQPPVGPTKKPGVGPRPDERAPAPLIPLRERE